MKFKKPLSTLENPVLHFTSATYKCEAEVRQCFKRATVHSQAAMKAITDGLIVALTNKVPVSVVSQWLTAERVPKAGTYIRQYERIMSQSDLAAKVVEQTITWNKANAETACPRNLKDEEAVQQNLVHRLAVFTVKRGKDEDAIITHFRDEVETVRGNNYDC